MNAAEVIARAKAYPFRRPKTSVVVVADQVVELVELAPAGLAASRVRVGDRTVALEEEAARLGAPVEELPAPRRAVLAYGSNASPDSLRWKFPGHVAVLPLLRGTAPGVDVVYSAHMTVYGSIAATLQGSPGTLAEVFVALLTEDQLAQVTEWEINAEPRGLALPGLELEGASATTEVIAFVSRHGCLTACGREIALADVPARDRRFPAMTEPEALEHARALAAPKLTLDDFILDGVRDYDRARAYTAKLRETARPFTPASERRAAS